MLNIINQQNANLNYIRYYNMPARMAKIRKTETTKFLRRYEKLGRPSKLGNKRKVGQMYNHFGKQFGSFL